uniref:Ig-like domain-containing protein n=1 Tax=Pseudonaja textilis TaxID=8673 RepID=A0A670Y6B8_PSETE
MLILLMSTLQLIFIPVCITEPATIIDKAVSIDVTEGDPATLQCKFSGTKDISAKWLRDGKELTFEKNDSGEYTFEVSNDVGSSSCKASINVLGVYNIFLFSCIKGSFVHLECIVSGSHPISIQWFKDGQEISASEKHKYSFHDNTAFLEINQLQGSDSGSYTCEATNEAGENQCSAYLTVKGLDGFFLLGKIILHFSFILNLLHSGIINDLWGHFSSYSF